MKKFLLVSFVAASAMAAVVTASVDEAQACRPHAYPTDTRVSTSSEIVVGQVLEVTPLESATHQGEPVTLYQLSVHVGDTLMGSTAEDDLVTVYVIARGQDPDAPANDDVETHVAGDGVAPAASTASTSPADSADAAGLYGQVPDAPRVMQDYIFFAKPFGSSGELVLADNQANFLVGVDEHNVATTRQDIENHNNYGGYYY